LKQISSDAMARDCSWTAQVTLLKKAAGMIGFRHACKLSQQMLCVSLDQ
jgi:hypothetical protein